MNIQKSNRSFGFQVVLVIALSIVFAALTSLAVLYQTGSLKGSKEAVAKKQLSSRPETSQEAPAEILGLNEALVSIAEAAKPSVVTVFTERTMRVQRPPNAPFFNDPFFDRFFRGFFGDPRQQQPREQIQRGLGSGVIVSSDGKILTNNHVIQGADQISVRTFAGETLEAKVVGRDPQTDIAVIEVKASDLVPMPIGSSEELRVGEIVMAVGSPLSENLAHTVTQGIVSAKGRSNVGLADYEDFIQTDAAINPGNSGGALIDLSGSLVGINTAIATRSGGYQGVSFAVPIDMAKRVMDSLIARGEVVRGWLGVYIQDLNPELAKAIGTDLEQGALVADVEPGGPADKGGLQSGDIVIEANGEEVESGIALRNQVAASAPGTEIELKVIRDAKEKTLRVVLERLPTTEAEEGAGPGAPQEAFSDLLGFKVSTITPELRARLRLPEAAQGVVVVDVVSGSQAQRSGLKPGDLIQAINKKEIRSVADFKNLADGIQKGASLLLKVQRESRTIFLAFTT